VDIVVGTDVPIVVRTVNNSCCCLFYSIDYLKLFSILELPVAFFHEMCGLGKPSALPSILTLLPRANALSVGSMIQRGGTLLRTL
jgi:hypothetical protein